jgi:hypothetical protein
MIPISSNTNNNNLPHNVGVESVRNTTFNLPPITSTTANVSVPTSTTNNSSEYTIPDYVQRILDEVKQKQNTSSGFYNTNSQTTATTTTTTTTTTNQLVAPTTSNNTHLSQVQPNSTYVSNNFTPAVTNQTTFGGETNYFNHEKDHKKSVPTLNNVDSTYQTSYRFAVEHPQSQSNPYSSQAIYDSYKLTNVINSSLPYQDYGAIRKESTPLLSQLENQFKPQTAPQYNFVPTSTQRDTIETKEQTHQLNQQ